MALLSSPFNISQVNTEKISLWWLVIATEQESTLKSPLHGGPVAQTREKVLFVIGKQT